jgi:hypothetical protein
MEGITQNVINSNPYARRAKIIGKAGVALQTRKLLK